MRIKVVNELLTKSLLLWVLPSSEFLDICCPSRSRAIVSDEDDILAAEDSNLSVGTKPLSPIMVFNAHNQHNVKDDFIATESKVDESEILRLIDNVDQIVQNIKIMNTLNSKEEAEVEKTLSILRSQLNPKRRKKKEALKRFNFSIFKTQSPRNKIGNCAKENPTVI